MPQRMTMTISIPAPMKGWVDTAVSAAGYGTASEYIRELVRQDHHRRVKDAINAELIASVDSGPARKVSDADWKALHQRLRAQDARRRARRTG